MFWIQVTSLCLLSLIGLARSVPGYAGVDYHAYPKYSFKYGVNDAYTGDIKTHSEHRDGDVVKGQYSLVEPDGSVRQVEYTADPVNGFNAVVLKSQPTVHAAVLKPVVVAAPTYVPKTVPVPVPVPVAVTAAPIKYIQSPQPIQQPIYNIPYTGHVHSYTSEHDAYNAFLQSRHYDYGHY